MKKTILFMYMLLQIGFGCMAQATFKPNNIFPRSGDELERQKVINTHEADVSKNTIWDLRNLHIIGNNKILRYISPNENESDSIVVSVEDVTGYYYHISDSSLYLCGFENNQTRVLYDTPQLILHTPLIFGKKNESYIKGTTAYCEKMFMRTFGTNTVKVDGAGILILPSGDTLTHVRRVHVNQISGLCYYPNIKSERQLKVHVDSIPFPTDSIISHLQSDSLLNETNIYRWYALGYRYPILETIEIGLRGEKPFRTESFYYDPDKQAALDDSENEYLRNLIGENKDIILADEVDNSFHNTVYPIRNASVSVCGTNFRVCLELTTTAYVHAMVCDVTGVVYRQSSINGQSGEILQMDISSNGLRKGEYVIYIDVNGLVKGYTISL